MKERYSLLRLETIMKILVIKDWDSNPYPSNVGSIIGY